MRDWTTEAAILGVALMFAASFIDIEVNVYVDGKEQEVKAAESE